MYNIIQKRKYFYWVSGALVGLSILALFLWGLNLGIDFKGGTLMEVRFTSNIEKEAVSGALSGLELKSLTLQNTDNNGVLVRYLSSDEAVNEKVVSALKGLDENVEQVRVDFIGSSVSQTLARQAIEAILAAMIVIGLFIAWAFRKVSHPIPSWQYGLNAIIALVHDILITMGVFAVLGEYHNVEVGIPFVAALLTILGYSINDTIVVYDRTRENQTRYGHKEEFESIVNRSLNETIARSINTSLTVIIVLIAILLFGGESIRYFCVALLVGVVAGTYSSIYIATALLVTSYNLSKRKGTKR